LKPLPKPEIISDPVRLPRRTLSEPPPCFSLNTNGFGKALVFHDSFACSWYPFLGQHFKEVVYIWHYEWDRPLIEREKPDVVIDEILERFFNVQDPNDLARRDQLPTASILPNAP